jgi:hypothetical protein
LARNSACRPEIGIDAGITFVGGKTFDSDLCMIAAFPRLVRIAYFRNEGLHETRRHGDKKMYQCGIADYVWEERVPGIL